MDSFLKTQILSDFTAKSLGSIALYIVRSAEYFNLVQEVFTMKSIVYTYNVTGSHSETEPSEFRQVR